jgi:hypothetical protein
VVRLIIVRASDLRRETPPVFILPDESDVSEGGGCSIIDDCRLDDLRRTVGAFSRLAFLTSVSALTLILGAGCAGSGGQLTPSMNFFSPAAADA